MIKTENITINTVVLSTTLTQISRTATQLFFVLPQIYSGLRSFSLLWPILLCHPSFLLFLNWANLISAFEAQHWLGLLPAVFFSPVAQICHPTKSWLPYYFLRKIFPIHPFSLLNYSIVIIYIGPFVIHFVIISSVSTKMRGLQEQGIWYPCSWLCFHCLSR